MVTSNCPRSSFFSRLGEAFRGLFTFSPVTFEYLGLTPREHSSGERRRQGVLTKSGSSHVRRVLIEGAWAYRYPAKVSRHLQLRLEKVPKVIQDISWKAQVRLCKRYRRLVARGKNANQVVVAIARELVPSAAITPPVASEVTHRICRTSLIVTKSIFMARCTSGFRVGYRPRGRGRALKPPWAGRFKREDQQP